MPAIKHLFHINAPIKKVFSALTEPSELSQWYTTIVRGKFQLNEIVLFEFQNLASFEFEIIHFEESKSIHMKCVKSPWDNVGHIFKYDLDSNEDKTRVRYAYEGFEEMDDSYANMNFSSGKYLESLRQFCQTGIGEAFGSDNYRS